VTIAQSSTKTIANYGQRVLDGLKALFKLIHQREKIPPPTAFADDSNDNAINFCAR
jgi:hypothetical protein